MKFTLFNISISSLIYRYYLLMAVIIIALYSGQPAWAFLALPIFISALMGIQFSLGMNKVPAQVKRLHADEAMKQAS